MRSNIVGLAVLLVACAPPPGESGASSRDDEGSSPADAPDSPDQAGDPDPESAPARDDVGDDPADDPAHPEGHPGGTTGGDEDGGDFLSYVDMGGVAFECDTWSQDCPEGFKCTMWANDGGGAWNATKCVEIVKYPDLDGEVCTVLGSPVSGEDSCELGNVCWDVDLETNKGMCVPFCIGNESQPQCADPDKVCAGGKSIALCLDDCDPLAGIGGPAEETDEGLDMCPAGCACYPQGETFFCAPDMSGDMGAAGEPCEFVNVCDPGHFCIGAAAITSCEGSGCCVPVCDVTDPLADTECAAFDSGTSCEAWFEAGQAPPEFENLGACVVPY